jgi:CheY-like chemotaxis protein
MLQPVLQSDKIETTVSTDRTYQEMSIDKVMLDGSRILQILINLLTNAIKFVRDQNRRAIRVQLSASYTQPPLTTEDVSYIASRQDRSDQQSSWENSDGEELFLTFALVDSGHGLTKEEMKHLFKRFSQASPKTYGQYGGSGLGLFICRELVELQGGQIGLSSVLGQGTTVKFFIKARRATDPQQTELDRPSRASISSQIRNIERKQSLQSNDTSSCEGSISSASCPPNRNLPMEKISTSMINQANEPLHILIVEDNIINQRVMSRQLRQLGCITYTANHGLEALSFLGRTQFYSDHGSSTEKSQIPLSCILCDLEMPVMDGLTCIRKIRSMQRDRTLNSHVPVMAVTANARGEQVDVAIEAGMVSFCFLSMFTSEKDTC